MTRTQLLVDRNHYSLNMNSVNHLLCGLQADSHIAVTAGGSVSVVSRFYVRISRSVRSIKLSFPRCADLEKSQMYAWSSHSH